MAHVHQTVTEMSVIYKINDKRYNYTTPKSFLELINLYRKILSNKNEELLKKINRLENGLEKLRVTGSQVEELKAQLALQEVELAKKNAEADHLIQVVGVETEKVTQEKAIADEEKVKVDQINKEVTIKQIDCAEDLKKAEPALFAAQEALNTLNKANLTELKSFGSPPSAVLMVLGAVMVLMIGQQGKIPKDRSWAKIKLMMAKVDQFLDALINYEKENIPANVLAALEPYLKDKDFDPDFVKSKSAAAAGLCSWVINIIKFHEIYSSTSVTKSSVTATSVISDKKASVAKSVNSVKRTQSMSSSRNASKSVSQSSSSSAKGITTNTPHSNSNGLSKTSVKKQQVDSIGKGISTKMETNKNQAAG